MPTYNLALIGFGGVNRALAQLIADVPNRFAHLGFDLQVVACLLYTSDAADE